MGDDDEPAVDLLQVGQPGVQRRRRIDRGPDEDGVLGRVLLQLGPPPVVGMLGGIGSTDGADAD
ncbi:hypothetical protein, partial [Bradyrhizobium sp. NBAIM08]|uniref:hypothetical protein n=1 Tax=Bradyrhizobium sp. NBAIM08 TaxID=2793815 RepID=UPI001CD211DB